LPGRKGQRRATPEMRQRFWDLLATGEMTAAAAAREVGMTESWGWAQTAGKSDKYREMRDRAIPVLPDPKPKTWTELDDEARECLKDFNLFRETFLVRDHDPWAKTAADLAVEWLMDRDERTYAVENMPPGAGKTTIFFHDLFAWLICGGGFEDPAKGRAVRLMIGSFTKNIAIHNVERLKRTLETPRPYYDKQKKVRAKRSLTEAYGYFKPKVGEGDYSTWTKKEFLVAQMADIDLYEKEPTVQAASREAGFLGERVDLAVWDDLVVRQNSNAHEKVEELANWFEDEAETRIEPGGVLLLVGQRLTPIDLYRNRLDVRYEDELGVEKPLYRHVVYPAHNEATCANDGNLGTRCSQWDGKEDGCLLNARRLSVRDLLKAQSKAGYRTVYQQEDSDPLNILVQKVWLEGGTDSSGFTAIGCYDTDRGFYEWPQSETLVNFVTVDPSVSNYWVAEWKAYDFFYDVEYLIYAERTRMQAGDFLDWDPDAKEHVGLMEDWTQRSAEFGQPIRAWIVEQNAAHKYLFQMNHFHTWRRKWAMVEVWAHQTQKNKTDENFGVEALLPSRYKSGRKRLPRKSDDIQALNYMRAKVKELTTYPASMTDDIVMADWFGEFNIKRIKALGERFHKTNYGQSGAPLNIPGYVFKSKWAPRKNPSVRIFDRASA
jgi:hypothetical protein